MEGPYAKTNKQTTTKNKQNKTKKRFANDVDRMGGSNGELQDLTNRLVDSAMAYGMEAGTGKSQIMTNRTNKISAYICMNSLNGGDQLQLPGNNPGQG